MRPPALNLFLRYQLNMSEVILKTPEEMKTYAAQLALQARAGDVYCLKGNLGAGKTTFAQGFISALLQVAEPITSPTFNLVQIYKTKNFLVYHCDLYRLKNENEFINLGLDDAFIYGVTLIEWPEMAEGFMPKNAKYINIEALPDESRKINIG